MKCMTTQPIVAPSKTDDFMPLHGIDHVEFYVGNALQAASFWVRALGFKEVAYAGLETGVRDRASHVLEQGRIRIVLTGALVPGHEIGAHVAAHGDGVKVIALGVPDVDHAYREATARGARGVDASRTTSPTTTAPSAWRASPPTATRCTRSSTAAITRAPSCPATRRATSSAGDAGLLAIDHIVGNVELGHMDEWVKYYEDVFGMREMLHFSDEDISTEYSALMSKVVTNGNGRVKFPLNEPAEGKRKSQIDEYLEYYGGAGAQHIAVATRDIVKCVEELKARGIEFLNTPETYYEDVPERVGEIAEDFEDLKRLGILVDRDDEGYLLQIFTKPIGDRPTVFLEVIERHGARGFGDGNFKALFEAIEREQALRGNL